MSTLAPLRLGEVVLVGGGPGGHPDQEVLKAPLHDIARVADSVRPPAVTVIGEVARWAFAAPEEETR